MECFVRADHYAQRAGAPARPRRLVACATRAELPPGLDARARGGVGGLEVGLPPQHPTRRARRDRDRAVGRPRSLLPHAPSDLRPARREEFPDRAILPLGHRRRSLARPTAMPGGDAARRGHRGGSVPA